MATTSAPVVTAMITLLWRDTVIEQTSYPFVAVPLLIAEFAQRLARDVVKCVELGLVVLAPAPDGGRRPDLLGRHALHRLARGRAVDEVEQLHDGARRVAADVLVSH